MAHEWYIKRGEKTYGPFTSAQLKKLAGEGKISPASEVRLGGEGAWTQASRVKGLFATPGEGSSSASISISSPVSALPPIPPPVAKPMAATPPSAIPPSATPPVARPLTASPLGGTFSSPPVPAVPNPPLAGKLVGAVGLTFGVLALGTCWLSLLEPIFGWVGIAVGALGLVIGIAGLVVAALQNASGLVSNVAAASTSLTGLVVSVVLGINSGLFTKPAPPVVAAPPMIVQSPPAPAPKVETPAPQPEPVPAPVWTDASQAIEQGPLRARITSAVIEQVRLESANPLSMKREKAAPYLHVRVSLKNISTDKIVTVPGWLNSGAGSSALGAVGQALGESELGKQLAGATASALLSDDQGNGYPQVEAMRLPSNQAELDRDPSLRPGESSEKHLLFERPLETAEFLRIELSAEGFGGSEPLRFQIPRSMWTDVPSAGPGTSEPTSTPPRTSDPTDTSLAPTAAEPPSAN